MAINPFRVGDLQLPQPLRPVPIDFSPLQSIGEGIGQYRQQQQIGSILAGATDASGNVDPIKAATALGAAGFGAHAQRMLDTALRQKALTSAEDRAREERRLQERGQDITKGHYGDVAADLEKRRKLDEDRLKLDEQTRKQGNTFYRENPLGVGPGYYETLKPDGTIERRQASPPAPVVAPSTIGPRSDVAPGVLPGGATFADRFDPENAPPTRVATLGDGLLSEPPIRPTPGTQTAQAGPAPAPTPAPLSPGLQDFARQNGPDAARVLKDILEYKRGPLHGKEEAWITAAQQVDPSYDPLRWQEMQKEAKTPPRQFSVADVEKITEKGSKARDTLRFSESFKPEFAGYKSSAGGAAAMAVGRYLGDNAAIFDKDLPKASQWWQDYDEFKNTVRKGTFGATLTGLERQAFERASINPGMDAKQIQENLGRQKILVTEALKREANTLIRSGYSPAAISDALGLDLKQLGVTAEGKQRGGRVGSTSEANDAIGRARNAYRQGAPRDAVLEQMRKDGIPNPEMVLGN